MDAGDRATQETKPKRESSDVLKILDSHFRGNDGGVDSRPTSCSTFRFYVLVTGNNVEHGTLNVEHGTSNPEL